MIPESTCPFGDVLVRNNRVLNRPLGRLLRSFARTPDSALSLHSASLARFVHGLAHSLHSLPHGTVEIHEYVIMLLSRFTILSPPDLTLALPSLLGLTSAFHVLINVMVHPCVL